MRDSVRHLGPVALIRPYRPPSPAVREKGFRALATRWSGSPGGSPSRVTHMPMFTLIVRALKLGPVALIRPYRPPSPAAREKGFRALASRWFARVEIVRRLPDTHGQCGQLQPPEKNARTARGTGNRRQVASVPSLQPSIDHPQAIIWPRWWSIRVRTGTGGLPWRYRPG